MNEVFNVIYPVVSRRKGDACLRDLTIAVGWLLYRSGWKPDAHIQPNFSVCQKEIRNRHNFGGSRFRIKVFPLLVDVVHLGYKNPSDPDDKEVSEYRLNLENLEIVCQILEVSPYECRRRWIKKEVARLADVEFKNELKKGKFTYSIGKNEKGYGFRVYHPLTSMRGSLRDHVFLAAGYRHQYDIKSCFPTLLAQVAGSYGAVYAVPTMSWAMGEPDRFRELVARSCGLLTPADEPDVDAVKAILSALMFGARLQRAGADVLARWSGLRKKPKIWTACGECATTYNLVVECPLIRGYQKDVLRLTRLMRGKVRDQYWSTLGSVPGWMSERNWLYWFAEMLEEQVRTAMCEYVRSNRGRVFELHDCVISDVLVDVFMMCEHVKKKTGFDVRITHDMYTD